MNTPEALTGLDQPRPGRPDGSRVRDQSPGHPGQRARLGRLLSAVVAPLAALTVLRLLYGAALHAWPPGGLGASSTVDEVVLGLLSWAAVAICAWLALGVTLTALTRIPGRVGQWVGVLADRVTPAVLRRSLTMLLGLSVSTVALPTGTASGAVTTAAGGARGSVGWTVMDAGPGQRATTPIAEPTPAFVPSRSLTEKANPTVTDSSTSSRMDEVGPGFRVTHQHDDQQQGNQQQGDQQQGNQQGNQEQGNQHGPGWRPTAPVRTAGEPSTLLTPAPRTASAPIEHVTVRRGDSLWTIVARHLGSGASDAEIAHEWPRWFAANAAVIGDDPDLIFPGQQLVAPLEGARR
ncbi:MAG: hypothetical protein ABI112_08150 [Terracoccus sp.]